MEELLKNFSPWHPWTQRAKAPEHPGVYILCRPVDGQPEVGVPTLSTDIVYVGETCDQTLRKRLYQFHRSAFEEKFGHSGGATYNLKFAKQDHSEKLFFSFLLENNSEVNHPAFVRFVERALIWSFVSRYGVLPICNRK